MACDSNASTSRSRDVFVDNKGKDEEINEDADLVSILAKLTEK